MLNLKHVLLLSLLAVLSACAEKSTVELHCEHSNSVAEDGSILTVSDAIFDLTVDLENKSISSERYPNFGVIEPTIRSATIGWLAAPEGKDPYSIPVYGYTISRYTGALSVSRQNEDFESSVAQGRCVTTKPIF